MNKRTILLQWLQIVMGLVCYVIVMRKYRITVSGRKEV